MNDNFQQVPVYESVAPTYAPPMYSSQYVPSPYIDQGSAPIAYSVNAEQPPPPPYNAVAQSPPVQVQPQPMNQNSPLNGQAAQGMPFSAGYKWPRRSVSLVCPKCGATVKTRLETETTIVTIIGAVLLLFFTLILVCLPFCIPACKKSTHYCPYCNGMLGVRRELR